MKDIYDRLERLGFKPKFVQECILPSWWKDDMAEIPANRQYAELVLSRQLGIELASLSDRNAELQTQTSVVARFKHRKGATNDQLSVAQRLGWRAAVAAAMSAECPFTLPQQSASAIRQHMLQSGCPWIGLDELLAFCWESGIPVVNLQQIPDGQRKMDGMATMYEGRPVIVIGRRRAQPAWHLFDVAHELGHIALGHVEEGCVRVDEEISLRSAKKSEKEANIFAIELLSGDPEFLFSQKRRPTGPQLAQYASEYGQLHRIDPGFLCLSYAWKKKLYPLGERALKSLSSGRGAGDPYRRFYGQLDLDELPEDSRHVFQCLTKAA